MGSHSIGVEEFAVIDAKAKALAKAKAPFERLVLSKEDALRLFADNPFKVHTIKTKIPDGALTTAYRCGSLVDLCRGPHLPHTGRIEAFSVVKNSSAYFLGQVRVGSGACVLSVRVAVIRGCNSECPSPPAWPGPELACRHSGQGSG